MGTPAGTIGQLVHYRNTIWKRWIYLSFKQSQMNLFYSETYYMISGNIISDYDLLLSFNWTDDHV